MRAKTSKKAAEAKAINLNDQEALLRSARKKKGVYIYPLSSDIENRATGDIEK